MRTTTKQRDEVLYRLIKLGIGYEQANQLRRISMTLRRWFEMECGTENRAGQSVSIEREGGTDDGKPFLRHQYQSQSFGWIDNTRPIPDREAGARKRLGAIMAKLPGLIPYVQTDCRGASLYVLRAQDIKPGENIDSIYTRGTAVY